MELDDIKKLGELARISLSDGDAAKLQKDFGGILNYVDEIKKVDVSGVVTQKASLRNVFRKDEVTCPPNSYREKILASAPETKDGYFVVKKIIS